MNWKKGSTLVAAASMLAALAAGCGSGDSGTKTAGTSSSPAASGSVSPSASAAPAVPVKKTYTMLTESQANWPYSKDWPVWKWLEEKTGATFDVQLPSGKIEDSLNLAIASGNMPDMMYMPNRTYANKYGQQGALVNILEYKDQMPNFKKWMEKYPKVTESFLSSDGKLYLFPNEGFGETNRTIWLYREDIFKKNNLKPPTTYDELYAVGKKLKELYPASYPFSFRFGMTAMLNMAPNFSTSEAYYTDEKTKEVKYGPTDDNYKKMVEYLNKFYEEGLIPPDWLTLETKQWQDLLSTDKAFITVDYIGRIDFFNSALRKEKPGFNMAFMAPPAGIAGGKQQNPYTQVIDVGFAVSSKSKNVKDLMKVMDFYYSEEGRDMLSWGKEGETFTMENGKKKIKADKFTDVADMRKKTGLATFGTYAWIDYDAHLSLASKELQAAYAEARKFDSVYQPKPAYNEKETEVISTTGTEIDKYRDEQISKFILGEKNLEDWSKYVDGINKLGLKQVTDIYKAALERTAKAK
ncbi:extracellular solute-binding protein [Paenibacillus sp. MBLB4367]|uniref:extracellular solute-binding protein n=1 Tax=Paenibacillus sp. MBLB4367 TaxID=3384767 RepID=UPI0039084431